MAEAPADLFLAETDAPYATPVPYRGQRNEPVRVLEVIQKIAEIRGVFQDTVTEQLAKNALAIFKLAQ